MVSVLVGQDGSVADDREVYPRVGNQVRLEVGEVSVERSHEAKAGGHRRDCLRQQPVETGIGRAVYVQVGVADVVHRLVVGQ